MSGTPENLTWTFGYLARLRTPGNLSQGWGRRAETGAFLLSEDDVRKLSRVYGAAPEVQRQLVEMTRDLREGSPEASWGSPHRTVGVRH